MQHFIIFFIIVYVLRTASCSSKQTWHIADAVCTVLELLMMGGETARNMWSIDNNKEYCKTLYLVGCTASGSSKQAWHIADAVCTVFELLMIGGETARNM